MNKQMNIKHLAMAITGSLWLGAACNASAQEVSAGFEAGGSLIQDQQVTEVVDGVPGAKGDGWLREWTVFSNGSSIRGADVLEEQPLDDASGKYLSYSFKTRHSTPLRQFYLARCVAIARWGGINFSAPYTVSFMVRPDDLSALQTPDAFLLITDTTSAGNCEQDKAGRPQDGQMAWGIRIATAGTWELYDGNKDDSFDVSRYKDTGVKAEVGKVYTITVTVQPAEQSWQAVIDSGAETRYESPLLGTACADVTPRYGRWVMLGSCLGNERYADRMIDFSLDNLTVKQGTAATQEK
jgi:hypothetical protein